MLEEEWVMERLALAAAVAQEDPVTKSRVMTMIVLPWVVRKLEGTYTYLLDR